MIVTINIGSSSVRLGLHTPDGQTLDSVHFDRDGDPADRAAALSDLADRRAGQKVEAVCHRIVHGGPSLGPTCFLDEAVEQEIEKATPLAPLHNPPALRWIAAARQAFPHVRHFAAFDTGLYDDLPDVAAHYALPEEFDVKRLGFHGLAHRHMLRQVKASDPEGFSRSRVISLQLGSGCSATASLGGRAIDTSMGHTPLEGLVMATRAGDIDPGLVLHFLSERGMSVKEVEELLGERSGIRGVSGLSADMRELLASDDSRAGLAVDMFCYRVRKYIGAYAVALGGLDHLVFGGGVGENQPEIRARIADGLACLGAKLAPDENARHEDRSGVISAAASKVRIHVCKVDENSLMAEDTAQLLRAKA